MLSIRSASRHAVGWGLAALLASCPVTAQVVKLADFDVPNRNNIGENGYQPRNVRSGYTVTPMRLTGVGGGGFTGHYHTNGWNSTFNPNKYISFTVNPSRDAIQFDRIAISQFNFSTNNTPSYVGVRSSADGFATTLDTAAVTNSAGSQTNTLDLSAIPYQDTATEFRIYFWGHGSGGWQGSGIFAGHVGFVIYGEAVCAESGAAFTGQDCDQNGVDDACDLAHPGRFSNFTSGGSYALNGSAVAQGGAIRLTPASPDQMGTVMFEKVAPQRVDGFEAQFDFKMGGGNGADGIGFSVMREEIYDMDTLFGESTPGGSSMTIGLATFDGSADGGNTVRLYRYRSLIATYDVSFPLNDNRWHRAKIQYDGDVVNMTITSADGVRETCFDNEPVFFWGPFVSRYGLGARTGLFYDEHWVDNVKFRNTSASNDCQGNGVIDTCEADSDGDGVPDGCDVCEGFDDFEDRDGDGLPDACDPCPLDSEPDADGDGVCNVDDICPGFDDNLDTDGDGRPDGCDSCFGDNASGDSDGDGVCDSADLCPGSDDRVDTDGDGTPDGCDACPVDASGDSDGDGVCDSVDLCPGSDDTLDTDGDGNPDACDACPLDSSDDSDGDGVCDSADVCSGSDDNVDTDGDGIPDGCDACPLDATNDSDGDGVCDSADVCPGGEDDIDTDGDGMPDACDACPQDASDDSDGDGVCDSVDICPGGDDNLDANGDGIADDCAPACPGDADGDNDVDLNDLAITLSDFGCSTACQGDIDEDGDTDLSDLAALLANFGRGCN